VRDDEHPPVAMDIALFASSFHPHRGGVEELVRQLAADEIRNGNRPIVATMRWPKDLPARETVEGVPVRRVVFRVPEHSLRSKVTTWTSMPLTVAWLTIELRRHGVDVVHVQCVSGNGWYAAMVARLLRRPVVVTLQGELFMDASAAYQRSRFLPGLLRRLLSTADAVTACSDQTLREAEAFTGIALGSRGSVIHNGVRLADFEDVAPFDHPRPYVLGIGRLVREKGFDLLLDAFDLLADEVPDIDLVLAGSGREEQALIERRASCRHRERMHLIGAVDRPTAVALFAGAAAFALSSRHEPFGIVNLEAMAAGTPVVATDVGGVSEIVEDGTSGVLVAGEDADALAAGLRLVLTDRDLAARLVDGGRRVAAAHDWPLIAAAYRDVYDRVGAT
jgi:glycogen(starch) synthase